MARTVSSISIPEPLLAYIKKRVRSAGYASVSEYIRELIRADQREYGADPDDPAVGLPARMRMGPPRFRGVDLTRKY